MNESPLWVERYRPKTVSECILPEQLQTTFQKFVDQKSIPNLLLTGRAGVGKTTIARAMLDEIGAEYVIFNGSLNVDKDALRNEIRSFATTVSIIEGGRKYIILDEADYLSAVHVQPALRNFMEEFSTNVGFILTCNFRNKIIQPLHSRCSVIEFLIPAKEIKTIAAHYHKRICGILDRERVDYDRLAVAGVIKHFFPDLRRILNEIQRYAVTGKIDSGILSCFAETSIEELMKFLKEKNFTAVRKWIAENPDIEPSEMFGLVYDIANQHLQHKSVPVLVLILAKYQYQSSFCADQNINTTACMIEIMSEVQFK